MKSIAGRLIRPFGTTRKLDTYGRAERLYHSFNPPPSAAVALGSAANMLLIGSFNTNLLPTFTWLCTTMLLPCSRRIFRLTGIPYSGDALLYSCRRRRSTLIHLCRPRPRKISCHRAQIPNFLAILS